ncbi:MAG: hypothetical protein JWR39_461 [Devosia sp.]|nr:hypothetical protein [Devosia sp.]
MKLSRRLMLAILAVGCLFASAVPVVRAGQAENAFLQQHVGDFTGRGELRGETTESVACRLQVQSSTAQRLRYSGRCVIAGDTIPLRGTIAYSDREGRYEASATGLGTVVGRAQNNGVSFTLGRDYRRQSRSGNFRVTFALSRGSITLDLTVADAANGAFQARVPLSR